MTSLVTHCSSMILFSFSCSFYHKTITVIIFLNFPLLPKIFQILNLIEIWTLDIPCHSLNIFSIKESFYFFCNKTRGIILHNNETRNAIREGSCFSMIFQHLFCHVTKWVNQDQYQNTPPRVICYHLQI